MRVGQVLSRALQVGLLALALGLPRPALAQTSGTVNWSNWSLSWAIEENAGIVIKSVYRSSVLYIHNAGLPVMRVDYAPTPCGPFNDIFTEAAIRAHPVSNNEFKAFAGLVGSKYALRVYANVGGYLLEQWWYFTSDGHIQPLLKSSGLNCHATHRHHPYWRFDFDINGSGSDRIHTQSTHSLDLQSTEFYGDPNVNMLWSRVSDSLVNRGAYIYPDGVNDNGVDGFAQHSMVGLLYKAPGGIKEGQPWPGVSADCDPIIQSCPGAPNSPYVNGENISSQDIVFWSASHLYHFVDPSNPNPNQMLLIGPDIQLY